MLSVPLTSSVKVTGQSAWLPRSCTALSPPSRSARRVVCMMKAITQDGWEPCRTATDRAWVLARRPPSRVEVGLLDGASGIPSEDSFNTPRRRASTLSRAASKHHDSSVCYPHNTPEAVAAEVGEVADTQGLQTEHKITSRFRRRHRRPAKPAAPRLEDMKQCMYCGLVKPTSEFYTAHNLYESGTTCRCKVCSSLLSREVHDW
jgi:hypothetical protein